MAWVLSVAATVMCGGEAAFLRGEFITSPESLHNHGSCIVELPSGDLLVCWYRGSGERQADDCAIVGAVWRKGAAGWGARFTMADTPDLPDTNCCMVVDPRGRLWLFWPTILDNRWESALLKVRTAEKFSEDGRPIWQTQDVVHVKPGPEFAASIKTEVEKLRPQVDDKRMREFIDYALTASTDKLKARLGWMTRAHPLVIEGRRLIVPLYSDGFDFSLMAITDDWGVTWHTSAPLVSAGGVQPSVVQRRDGSLYVMMRDNGGPPQRIAHASSFDRGETWTPVTDSALPDPGAGLEVIALATGRWLLVNNDTEKGRHSLCVRLSDDEGKTWKWSRHLERDAPDADAGRYGYPSVIQGKDGTLHATYTVQLRPGDAKKDVAGKLAREVIRHVQFNEAWIEAGDR